MEHIVRAIFISFIAIFGLLLNSNLSSQAQTLHYLKEDLEVAVHDAALELEPTSLAEGKVVFDQIKARATFITSFERNSKLTDSDYTILEMVFLDNQTVTEFPTQFTSSIEGKSVSFGSPTVIVFVETKRNAYFTNNSAQNYTQVASYTYKINPEKVDTTYPVELIGQPNELGFVWPVAHTTSITSPFGYRTHPIYGDQRLHAGIDIASPGVDRTPVVTVKSGTVTYASAMSTYGNLVIVDHGNGLQTRYAHLYGFNTTVGQSVEAGQVIGLVGNTGGSTGPHLHFEVRIDGVPYDPSIFFP